MTVPRRLLLAAPAALTARRAAAREAVDMLLVLAMDASGSIGEDEFRLQREGYAEALTHPQVVAAIRSKPRGAMAIAMIEWGSPGGSQTIVDWQRVHDLGSAQAIADALLGAPRTQQTYNAIGDAIHHASHLLREGPFHAEQMVIDVSGDGPDMRSMRPAPVARDIVVRRGMVVNALAISGSGQVTRAGETLEEHYRRDVMGGPGAFVITAESRRDIARALRAKLIREMA
ncbi:DUF1194 domain-containing protein [Sediminicoccus sp. KRV36]|uniref:DUF1194 domain-containing protein n=1 Tax=Sediminicoccus sp. KRV36 TaxID=3133721 RepID=UPI00200C9BF0|nr:DUF1194 domain-containing protein [Sediminicoccus rosea]UPY35446.1 DUF1194 domain-containing protein [Sediminicoccus rosea]